MTVFCTTDDVKLYAAQMVGWTGNDNLYTATISIASEMVRKFVRQEFDKVQRIEYFQTPEGRYGVPFLAAVKEPPIDLGQTFAVDFDPEGRFDDAQQTVDPTDYLVDTDRGKVTVFKWMPFTERGLRITYTGGYPVTSGNVLAVPDPIKQATAMQAAFMAQQIRNNTADKVSEMRDRFTRETFSPAAQLGMYGPAIALLNTQRRALVGFS